MRFTSTCDSGSDWNNHATLVIVTQRVRSDSYSFQWKHTRELVIMIATGTANVIYLQVFCFPFISIPLVTYYMLGLSPNLCKQNYSLRSYNNDVLSKLFFLRTVDPSENRLLLGFNKFITCNVHGYQEPSIMTLVLGEAACILVTEYACLLWLRRTYKTV